MSTTQIIMLSFLVAVLVGSLLLSLPISSVGEGGVSYIDALFTATTATCVTGLVTVTTATTWSIFGQAVILILVQIGGLGIITVMSGLMILINRRMGLGQRLLVQDALTSTWGNNYVSKFRYSKCKKNVSRCYASNSRK